MSSTGENTMGAASTIGVLALQGDFAAHARGFERLGCVTREVRTPAELEKVDGLVLPGGETTTLIKLMKETGLWDGVLSFSGNGKPIFGTCAGLILLARKVVDPQQDSLGLIDVTVQRNAYGRQVDSFTASGSAQVPTDLTPSVGLDRRATEADLELVFIRAPKITRVGESVSVLALHDGIPVLVRQGSLLAASFHPELSSDLVVESIFEQLVTHTRKKRRRPSATV